MRASEGAAIAWVSLAVLATGGCGGGTHTEPPMSQSGGSATEAGHGGASAAGVSGATHAVGGGAAVGGGFPDGGASEGGSGEDAPGGSITGGASRGGSSTNGGTGPAVDREWALWPMPNPASAGLPNPAKYDTTTEPLLAHDLVTGLTWNRAVSPDYHAQRDAVASCDALSLGGYDDWRLPTLIEYQSILDWTRSTPAIDTAAFPGDAADNLFWTASPAFGDPQGGAWIADFAFISAIATHPISDRFPVRCVRGGGSAPAVRYMVEADTVLDVATGLTWERHASFDKLASAEAAAYCEALDLAARTDWRLPGVGELATLVDLRTSALPMMDREAFPGDEDASTFQFWGAGLRALNFWGAEVHHYAASDTLRVRCVR